MPQYELNLRDYWQIIQKRRIVFAVVFLAVFISSAVYTNLQVPVYKATASVQWVERKTLGGMLSDLVTVNTADPIATQARVVTSSAVLVQTVMELGLAGTNPSEEDISEQVSLLQGVVSADVAIGTDIIHINVTHNEPQLAADIANKVAEAYIQENLREKTRESRGVREFIEKQLDELNAKLEHSEDILASFKETEVPSGVALPLQDRLSQLEIERQNLLQKYTPRHPEVMNIEEHIVQVKEQLKGLPQKELEFIRLTREVEINASLYRQLKDKLEAARIAEAEKSGDASIVDRAGVPGGPVSPNKNLNYMAGLIIGLMLGLTMSFLTEQLDTSIGTIEDVEAHLKLPALGVIPYLKTKDEKQSGFMQKIWPFKKELRGEEKITQIRKQLLVNYPGSSSIFEAYRILRTNIQTEVFKEKIERKVLLFTSSGPEEGKSITISNLAIVMAQANLRILLIDADMRRPTIHKIFGLKNKEPGLCNVLRGSVPIEQALRTFTDIMMGDLGMDNTLNIPGLDGLNILTSGAIPNIPAELLGSPEMELLLEKLRDKFDIILIDTPPVLAVADTNILSPKVDGVILVYRVGKTARSVLARTKTQLTAAGAQVKGVILNNISPEFEMRYGHYGHYKYYGKYYDEKKDKDEA